ncbi:putative stAR-related lipid transfer protein 9 [Penaeus vannamei]|uniref:Putative stAR-related lipid transfer protein 9 n=1 Tax=Penaeus vannamei TaxID=6689 RepID=A0A423TAZ1_PENVA|nr:putative stAR-related lipid transfer protein 9 [Penaeus vannamei]
MPLNLFQESPGLAPRICQGLLTRLQQRYAPDDLCAQDFSLTLSLVEIYNERVRDLLTGNDQGRHLRVREHPHTGPYVDGVTRHPITDTSEAWALLERGRASRSVAPTASHAHSSRSHALLTLDVTQPAAHTRSALTLVDLAGSERASEEVDKTRLTEGASINRSLVTLGNVISALAERGANLGSTVAMSPLGSNLSLYSATSRPSYAQSHTTIPDGYPAEGQRKASKLPFIPYRDSVLTWLLKDTLGGNAKTLMIATMSPSSTSFAETVATLRYATRARCIVNMPVVNLDSGTATIRSLKKEVAALRRLLCDANNIRCDPTETTLPSSPSTKPLAVITRHARSLGRKWGAHGTFGIEQRITRSLILKIASTNRGPAYRDRLSGNQKSPDGSGGPKSETEASE